MTSFFVGGIKSGATATEEAYSELCERSLVAAGCPVRPRRIFKLNCRFEGRDREIEVGRPLAEGREIVAAILDHGRFEAFRVHTGVAGGSEPALVSPPVYSVTEFS